MENNNMKKSMDIVIFPFHDMRKNQREGFRNRDSHFIEELSKRSDIGKLLIINRPTTPAELLYKRASWKTKGKVVWKDGRKRLILIDDKIFVLDYLSLDIWTNIKLGKAWFWKAFRSRDFIATVKFAIDFLSISKFYSLHNSLYSSSILEFINSEKVIFDADDNWLKFPVYNKMYSKLLQAYKEFSDKADFWTTNSIENLEYFSKEFKLRQCVLIKNGVNEKKFKTNYEMPSILKGLNGPIIGFGGSISHLIDTDLFNYIVSKNTNLTFVVIGPIINRIIFNKMKKAKNFHYLGNIHYSVYPASIQYFDICIIPYLTGNKAHGGDSIKFYEFLAANKKIVATPGNGVFAANENVYLAKTKEEFSSLIRKALDTPKVDYLIPDNFTWKSKIDLLLDTILIERP